MKQTEKKNGAKKVDPYKIVLSTHRVSYLHLLAPAKFGDDETSAKYSATFLIPKDHPDVKRIQKKIEEIYAENKESLFAGTSLKSPRFHNPLRDGDEWIDEHPESEEYEGCYFLKASSKSQPVVYDTDKNEILDLEDVYSGCYCRAVIKGWPFNNKAKGISFYLNSLQFIRDGERLGGYEASPDDYDARDNTDEEDLN